MKLKQRTPEEIEAYYAGFLSGANTMHYFLTKFRDYDEAIEHIRLIVNIARSPFEEGESDER